MIGTGWPERDPEPAGLAPNGLPYESVWDFPRPPRIATETRPVRIELGGELVAESDRALRVLETAGGPTIYVPQAEVADGVLTPTEATTVCEFKGVASYLDVHGAGRRARRAAWTYPRPAHGYEALTDYVSFYPARVECRLGNERVESQPGGFYGGWVTAELLGPIKGGPGSEAW